MSNSRQIRAQEIKPFVKGFVVIPSGQWNFLIVANRGNQEHIRGVVLEIEVLLNVFFQHGWSERPESFTIFDLQIQLLLHFWVAGVTQNASITQGAGTKLHTPL